MREMMTGEGSSYSLYTPGDQRGHQPLLFLNVVALCSPQCLQGLCFHVTDTATKA